MMNAAQYEPDDGLDELLVGTSAAMVTLRQLIRRVAPSDAAVLITGPSGSGKEMVARAIHHASRRANAALVPINCGAIPAELIESELFGHEKGSFTGAIAQRKGRFEQASGGTLFLDEIGDMPLAMQVKLLRVLEERRIERVGGSASIAIDTRIVCATHRDVDAAIERGLFREDLYFRLAVFPLHVAQLCERKEDIPALISHFIAKGVAPHPGFSRDALAALTAHDWPGNVRELRNMVDRARILFPDRKVVAADVPALLQRRMASASIAPPPLATDPHVDLRAMITDIERRHIIAALDSAHGVVADAARMVQMNRTTFLEKMRRHDVTRARIPMH